jgi:hypothetical protein
MAPAFPLGLLYKSIGNQCAWSELQKYKMAEVQKLGIPVDFAFLCVLRQEKSPFWREATLRTLCTMGNLGFGIHSIYRKQHTPYCVQVKKGSRWERIERREREIEIRGESEGWGGGLLLHLCLGVRCGLGRKRGTKTGEKRAKLEKTRKETPIARFEKGKAGPPSPVPALTNPKPKVHCHHRAKA